MCVIIFVWHFSLPKSVYISEVQNYANEKQLQSVLEVCPSLHTAHYCNKGMSLSEGCSRHNWISFLVFAQLKDFRKNSHLTFQSNHPFSVMTEKVHFDFNINPYAVRWPEGIVFVIFLHFLLMWHVIDLYQTCVMIFSYKDVFQSYFSSASVLWWVVRWWTGTKTWTDRSVNLMTLVSNELWPPDG